MPSKLLPAWTTECTSVNEHLSLSTTLTWHMAGVCQKMLGWARRVSAGSTGDMLELYCGNGNFTVAVADNFRWASALNPHRRCCCGKANGGAGAVQALVV